MGRKGKKRGKRGGRQVFLKALKKELNCVGEFDLDAVFGPPPPTELPAPSDITPYYYPVSIITRRSHLPKRQQPVKRRVARASETFVPPRIPTRPFPPAVYARKPPTSTPIKLKIRHNIPVHYRVTMEPSGIIRKKNVQGKQ
jgi:hypothetical protein